MLSLPNLKQLEAGDLDMDELVKKLTEALADESQRSEILQLTGDTAALVIECLDNVSETGRRSYIPSPYHPIGHHFRRLQGHSRHSNTLKSVRHYLKTLPHNTIPPSLLLDRSEDDNTPQRTLYIRNVRRGLPWEVE